MYLLNLSIENYRNIASARFEPSNGINVLWGQNGQGKSNLLEIIYFIGTLKSFRGGQNTDLITNSEQRSVVKASIGSKNVVHDLDLKIYPNTKKVLFNGKTIKNYKDYFSCLRPVIFSPEEVLVAKGLPSLRRALLDRAIFQAAPEYLEKVRNYENYLRQRNRALQERRSLSEIIPWTEGLVKNGSLLRLERHNYIQKISPNFLETYRHIADGREVADIHYSAGGNDLEELERHLRSELAKVQQKEIFFGQTLAGPHRDEIEFRLNGQHIKNYGSQGQQRSCILAFKTAQVMDLENSTGENPILLLDDLNSELDRTRQNFYYDFLMTRAGQVFITTTDPQPFVEHTLKNATFFQVVNGQIMAENEKRKQ